MLSPFLFINLVPSRFGKKNVGIRHGYARLGLEAFECLLASPCTPTMQVEVVAGDLDSVGLVLKLLLTPDCQFV